MLGIIYGETSLPLTRLQRDCPLTPCTGETLVWVAKLR